MEPYIGQLELFPYGFTPYRWALCDGRLLSINDNEALFSLIGTRFGGDGVTTFAVPDLSNAAIGPYNHYYIALQGEYPSRN